MRLARFVLRGLDRFGVGLFVRPDDAIESTVAVVPDVHAVRVAYLTARRRVVFSPFRMVRNYPVVPVLQPPTRVMPLLLTVVVAPRMLPGCGESGGRCRQTDGSSDSKRSESLAK
jgi:hypothetical protein